MTSYERTKIYFYITSCLTAYLGSLCLLMSLAWAGEMTFPQKGSTERAAILDAMRGPVMKQLKNQEIIFIVNDLRVKDGWAFANLKPKRKDGSPVDYRGTEFETAQRDGIFDEWIGALLKKTNGQWQVIELVIGATDYPPEEWPTKYGISKDLIYTP